MIIPAINEKNWDAVSKKLKLVSEFSDWAHIDVADGVYTPHITWNNPKDIKKAKSDLNIELHLMLHDPEGHAQDWFLPGVKRIIVHQESISDLIWLKKICDKAKVELMVSFLYFHKIDEVIKSRNLNDQFKYQVLAVNPGLAGQQFRDEALGLVKILREKFPKVDIEIDGGVKEQNIKLCQTAGANIFISSSFLWNSNNPAEIYKKLTDLTNLNQNP